MTRLRLARGQSILEIIVVLTLVGILAAVIMPSGAALPEMRLRAATDRLVSDLRYAQTLARQEGGRVGCQFDDAHFAGYTIVRTAALTPVTDPLKPGTPLTIDYRSVPNFKGVTIGWSTADAGVLFDVLGAPRSLSYVAWEAPETIALSLGTMTATITIQPLTGHVSSVVTT